MKKLVSLMLALALLLSLASIASADEVTHLVTISLGSKPVDNDAVLEAANAYTAEKYGITLEIRYLDWDPSKVYPIIMSTGDDVDLVFYSSWPGSQDWARKGGFVELEEYLERPEYAALKAAISEEAWEDVKIDGHIYCVPAPEVTYSNNYGIIYRSDLCESLNLPVPDSLENIEAYLAGVKAAYPDVYPMISVAKDDSLLSNIDTLVWANNTTYGIRAEGSKDNLVTYYGSDAQLTDLKRVREYVEKGYISRDLMNDTVGAEDKWTAGLCMLEVGHADGFGGRVNAIESAKADHPEMADWSVDFVPFNVDKGYVNADSAYNQNATGIAYANSQNIEASLTYLQAVLTDPELHHLIRYGIEGTHYTVDENGLYTNLSTDFTACGTSLWNWRSDALALNEASGLGATKKAALFEQYASCTMMTSSFAFDKSGIEDEVANYNAVKDEYLKPLQYGQVEDVEAGLKTFMEKANAAGLEKIQAEYIRQYNEWLAK